MFPDIPLPRRHCLVVGTGAIAVSFLPAWLNLLREQYRWDIRVALTHSAAGLVSPAALAAVVGNEVVGPAWRAESGVIQHREVAEWADLVLVMPATGASVAKLALGMADGVALTTVLFSEAPVVVAPALMGPVARRPSSQRHLTSLRSDGFHVVDPVRARSMHSGEIEEGGMPDLTQILRVAAHATCARYGPSDQEEVA